MTVRMAGDVQRKFRRWCYRFELSARTLYQSGGGPFAYTGFVMKIVVFIKVLRHLRRLHLIESPIHVITNLKTVEFVMNHHLLDHWATLGWSLGISGKLAAAE